MSTIFKETISRAISDYRTLLRRHLAQHERVNKLAQLGLKQPDYDNEVVLFRIAQRIVHDIETNIDTGSQSYYSYSGVSNFGTHLKKFLANYIIESNTVVNRAQKASRALLESIQLIGLPTTKMTTQVLDSINRNSMVIAFYGSEEQCELYRENLERYYRERGAFFGPLLRYFQEQLKQAQQVSQAA